MNDRTSNPSDQVPDTNDQVPDGDGRVSDDGYNNNQVFDVAVIGAGVVGAAVARELSGFELAVALVEGRGDVGDATSKANTAILHTGFDARPGTLESALVRRGYHLLADYAAATGIPVERTGAVLVAWNREELEALPGLAEKAARNGYEGCQIIDADAVYALAPSLGPGALGGLTVPDESIICPWTTTLAYATEAVTRGARLLRNRPVTGVTRDGDLTVLQTAAGPLRARWVVNAAGLGADVVDRWFGHDRFTVTPRRGELIVFDKLARPLVDRIVLPVPTARGKGVLVSPTVYGNVMLGPTNEDLTDRGDTSTSEAGLATLLEKGRALVPDLLQEEVTATYAGLRAAADHGDYLIDLDADQCYVCLGGIRSTGLSASLAIAEHVRDLLAKAGLDLHPRTAPPAPRMPNLGEAFPRPYQQADLIARDREYGRVVCFCERVTRGEIRDAFASPIPPCDLDGLRRRTRALMGRCQGFYCGAEVERLLTEHLLLEHPHETPAAPAPPPTAPKTMPNPNKPTNTIRPISAAGTGNAASAATSASTTDAGSAASATTVSTTDAGNAVNAANSDNADPAVNMDSAAYTAKATNMDSAARAANAANAEPAPRGANADPEARRPNKADKTHKPSHFEPGLSAARPRRHP